MNGREHSIDRVAHVMTSGAPSETFTARVMSPLCGAPQPGFSERVMARIEATRPRRRPFALQAAFAAAASLAILAAGSAWWAPNTLQMPVVPDAPPVAATLRDDSQYSPHAIPEHAGARPIPARTAEREKTTRLVRSRATAPVDDETVPTTPSIYVIDPLSAPAELSVKALEAPTRATTPLPVPKLLALPDLRIDPFKEKP